MLTTILTLAPFRHPANCGADKEKTLSPLLGLRVCYFWLRGHDLNVRPSGYEPDELPGCSTPRWYIYVLKPPFIA